MTFTTSLDGLAKGITIGVSLLFSGILVSQILLFISGVQLTALLVSVLLIVVYGGTYLFSPLHYGLTRDELVIHRPINNVTIARQKIKSVELAGKDNMKGTIRTLGVGGLFGYYGKFANFKTGSMTWYATRRNKTVLITTKDNKKIVVTPDEPEEFVQQFSV